MKHWYIFIALIIGIFFVSGCNKKDPKPTIDPTPRTVLVYMVARNDLGDRKLDLMDIDEMRTAVENGALNGGRLLVYNSSNRSNPKLIELTQNGETTLKTYSSDIPSTDVERIKEVMNDTRRIAPNLGYGLVLWSHGTGWIDDAGSRTALRPYSFGAEIDDENVLHKMKITSLAKALNGFDLEFIYFDNCHMGTIEVMYELRHAASYIVASATELPLEGMPYDLNIPVFFEKSLDLTKAAKNTYGYYCSSDASTNSCTIAVVDTRRIDDVATATRKIMEQAPVLPDDYAPLRLFRPGVVPNGNIYDMFHFITALSVGSSLLDEWKQAYRSAIIYHAATPTAYGLNLSGFSGLGCNILTTDADADNQGYRDLSWWNDVISHNPALHYGNM